MTNKKRIILTGATGFVGGAVAAALRGGDYDLVVFSRDPDRARRIVPGAADYVAWQAEEMGPWAAAVDGADAVIHCAGESMFEGKYSKEKARSSQANRLLSTRGLVNAMERAAARPAAFINTSSQGYYGFNVLNDAAVDETTPVGSDHWAIDNQRWEAEANRAAELGIRTANMRVGYVLGATGGGLPAQIAQARQGRSGMSKPAEAYKSWIHIDDVGGLYRFALENEAAGGPINVTAPNPVTNQEYADALGRALGLTIKLSPYFLARLFVGEIAEIYSRQRRVVPRQALALGYHFAFPDLASALADLVPQIVATA